MISTAMAESPASPRSAESDLLASLLALLSQRGGIPLNVTITPSERVQELQAHVEALEGKLSTLQAEYNRVEYLYRCECVINERLTDFCRSEGVRPPRYLFRQTEE